MADAHPRQPQPSQQEQQLFDAIATIFRRPAYLAPCMTCLPGDDADDTAADWVPLSTLVTSFARVRDLCRDHASVAESTRACAAALKSDGKDDRERRQFELNPDVTHVRWRRPPPLPPTARPQGVHLKSVRNPNPLRGGLAAARRH